MRPRLATALAALILVLAGCGTDDDAGTATSTEAATTEETTTAEPGEPAEDGGDEGARPKPAAVAGAGEYLLYFTRGEQFAKVPRELEDAGGRERAAAEALLAGPTAAEAKRPLGARTQIPAGVTLAGLAIEDDGTAVVSVGERFLAGIPALAAERSDAEQQELSARLGQLTYTLTQFEPVGEVKVLAGGTPVEPARPRAAYAKPAQGPVREPRAKGAESAAARAVQERLAKLRYLPRGAVDGVFGYRTQQAVIAFQSWEGLTRDGVVGPQTRAALAKAKRPRPAARGPERRIEVDRERGVALLIEGHKTKRAIHVSSGAPGTATPAGTYEVFRKELRSWSVPFQVWLPYASYFNQGIAFHEYPDVPAFPASHGCVRVPAPEAKGLYRFASLGTTVVVI